MSPREILRSLTDAASHLANIASRSDLTDELSAAIERTNEVVDQAYRELNESHQLVLFVEKGKVTSCNSDCETDMSCMVLSWDVDKNDPDNPDLVEVTWTTSPTSTSKVLTDHIAIEVQPRLVKDVVRTFDAERETKLHSLMRVIGNVNQRPILGCE